MKYITLAGVLILCCFCSVHAGPKRSSTTNESNMHELQPIQKTTPAQTPPRQRSSLKKIIERASEEVEPKQSEA